MYPTCGNSGGSAVITDRSTGQGMPDTIVFFSLLLAHWKVDGGSVGTSGGSDDDDDDDVYDDMPDYCDEFLHDDVDYDDDEV